MTARGLTIRQPWADLIAKGHKYIETRSWRAPKGVIGERVLIHAGKVKADVFVTGLAPWRPLLAEGSDARLTKSMTFGAIVASCTLLDCVPILAGDEAERTDLDDLPYPRVESHVGTGEFPDGWLDLYHRTLGNALDPESGRSIPHEAPFGDFAPGRFAWLLGDVKPTTSRCPRCWCQLLPGTGALISGVDGARCSVCHGEGVCDPVAMKGRLGLWVPDWGDTR